MIRASVFIFSTVLLAQDIERYELDKSAGATSGNLLVTVRGRKLSVSNKAIKVWPGWTRTKLPYTQPEGDSPTGEQLLRIYDAPAATSRTLAVEKAAFTDLTSVLLDSGDIALVLTMQDSNGVPWIALANEKSGVYRRERYAAPGAISKNMVEIRHFNPEDLSRANGDVSRIPPSSLSLIRLMPADPSPVGSWVAAIAGRNVTLTLRPGGSAEMMTEYAGRGQEKRQGAWSQLESELKVEFTTEEGKPTPSPIQWELKQAELVPKTWSNQEYGDTGLPMKRASPKRVP